MPLHLAFLDILLFLSLFCNSWQKKIFFIQFIKTTLNDYTIIPMLLRRLLYFYDDNIDCLMNNYVL
jgi:hypothetical protein